MYPGDRRTKPRATVNDSAIVDTQVLFMIQRGCYCCRQSSCKRSQLEQETRRQRSRVTQATTNKDASEPQLRPRELASPFMLLVSSLMFAILLLAYQTLPVEGVDCYKCSSRNGSNPACEDPFHNLNTTRVTLPVLPDPQPSVIYHTPCYAGRKNRDGLFPASACIKLTGVFDTTGETLVVRHCALDSGSLTQDTELARMSHCGKFQFEGDLLRGCVLACPEDACNAAHPSPRHMALESRHFMWLLALASPLLVALMHQTPLTR